MVGTSRLPYSIVPSIIRFISIAFLMNFLTSFMTGASVARGYI